MSHPPISRSPLPVGAVLLLMAACGDDPARGPAVSAGAGGSASVAGSAASAGTAGRFGGGAGKGGGGGALAGASGTNTGGTSAAAGASGSIGKGGQSGASASGSGGSAIAGASGAPPSAGAAGSPTLSDATPVSMIPTSCLAADGEYGCCGPDGNAYRGTAGTTGVVMTDCAGAPCGYHDASGTYRCGSTGEDPTGVARRSCGLPYTAGTRCPDRFCKSDAECEPALWGEGAFCSGGECRRCKVTADCPTGLVCEKYLGYCHKPQCTTDAQCAALDPDKPACHQEYHLCSECFTDAHCKLPGKNACFINTCGCKDDAACVGSPRGGRCDPIWLECGCKTKDDCAGGALCVAGTCSACASDKDCAATPARPYCVSEQGTSLCIECRKDTDCKSEDKPFCNQGTCLAGCQTSFDCDAPFPVCAFAETGVGACGPALACENDDAHEEGDDNPHTAKVILAKGAAVTGSICGLPGERDHYPFTVVDGEEVVLTLTSTEASVFVLLTDDRGTLLGMSIHQSPDVVHVRALPAGIYYAAVGLGVDDGSPSSVAYSLTRTGTIAPCSSDAMCAQTTSTELYRGRCAATGACSFIDGAGLLSANAPCDDDNDCQSGFCSGYAFAQNPGEQSRCGLACDKIGPLGSEPTSSICAKAGLATWWCTTHEEVNRCVPPCLSDDDCPVTDLLDTPAPGKPWRHLTCNVKGRCELPAD